MRSAVYEGVVTHRRHRVAANANVGHGFRHRTSMVLLHLDEIDEFVAHHPLWSASRRSPVHFRRRDYLGNPAVPLRAAVLDLVERDLGVRPSGPVALLTHVRTWGWLFNPLSLYYCYGTDGERVEALVLEVTSTPWHERHAYVLDGRDRHVVFPKVMHVSPFMGLDQEYALDWAPPSDSLTLHLSNSRDGVKLFDANLSLERRGASRVDLAHYLWRRPLTTYYVSLDIYRQAWRLWRKGAKFHPRRTSERAASTPTGTRS